MNDSIDSIWKLRFLRAQLKKAREDVAAKDDEIARLTDLVEFYRKAFPTEAEMAMRGSRHHLWMQRNGGRFMTKLEKDLAAWRAGSAKHKHESEGD